MPEPSSVECRAEFVFICTHAYVIVYIFVIKQIIILSSILCMYNNYYNVQMIKANDFTLCSIMPVWKNGF